MGDNKNKSFIKLISVSLISAFIGGLIFTSLAFYLVPKTTLFNGTPLYKVLLKAMTMEAEAEIASKGNKLAALNVQDIVKKVGPAVVGVSTYSGTQLEGEGTGIIFSKDGYIVTNNHVIQGGNKFKVTLSNKKEVTAKVINYDTDLDLAVLKIIETVEVPGVAEFGDSDKLSVGELAVAIGDPLGQELSNSVTTGVISALNRQLGVTNKSTGVQSSEKSQTYIQTDAAINEGNSGGPLIDEHGKVIGINSAKMGGTGIEGLGFSIPINIVKTRVKDLIKPMLMLGISAKAIDATTAEQSKLTEGVYIVDVTPNSSADKAGLKVGDVITKFDGIAVKTVDELNQIKAKHKPLDKVSVEIIRKDKKLTLTLKLEEGK